MHICDGYTPKPTLPYVPVPGHLYEHGGDGDIYIAAVSGHLVLLKDGGIWSGANGFGKYDVEKWRDVTDQYCLKKESTNV